MKTLALAPLSSLLVLCALACQRHESSASFSVTNLRSQAFRVRLDGGFLVAATAEAGVDRNGDGDGADTLLDVTDVHSGRTTLVFDTLGFALSGGYLSCVLSENARWTDLDGDGDRIDAVLAVYDLRAGTSVNLGLALAPGDPVQAGALVAFAVDEAQQGADLDGDGRALSFLPYAYEADLQRLTRIDVPTATSPALFVEGGRVVVVSAEDRRIDLNGDGDEVDRLVYVHDALTGTTQGFPLASWGIAAVDGEILALLEQEQGQDLDGNGRADDFLLALHDLETGAQRFVNEDVDLVSIGDGLVFMSHYEGLDVYDRLTDSLFEFAEGALAFSPSLSDRRAAFLLYEIEGDGNGDGDDDDVVLHVFDARTGQITNARVAANAYDAGPVLVSDHAAFLSSPSQNAPGRPPPEQDRAYVLDLRTGEARDLGLPADEFALEGELLVLLVPEAALGEDLDGDRDLDDRVVEIHDLATGRTLVTGLATTHEAFEDLLALEDRALAFAVAEADQGRDLNGDGDLLDEVLHVVRVR